MSEVKEVIITFTPSDGGVQIEGKASDGKNMRFLHPHEALGLIAIAEFHMKARMNEDWLASRTLNKTRTKKKQ